MTEESINNTGAFSSLFKNEALDTLMILALFLLGIKNRSDIETKFGQSEKEVPAWFLSAFPSLTREDEDHYNLILDSVSEDAKSAAQEFEDNMFKEGVHDNIRYIVFLVKLRREFMEQTKNPASVNKGRTRLDFGQVTLNDSASAFLQELLDEINNGGTPEEIYVRQKERARKRKLLPKKHWLRKVYENKVATLCYFVAAILLIWRFFSIVF